MSRYRKKLKKLNIYIYIYIYLVKDDKLFGKYNEIWEKVKNILKKEFDNEPVYMKKIEKLK